MCYTNKYRRGRGTDGLPTETSSSRSTWQKSRWATNRDFKLEKDIAEEPMEPMGYHPIAKMMQEAVAARKKVAVAQGAGDVTLDQGSEVIITVTRVFNSQLLFGQITNEVCRRCHLTLFQQAFSRSHSKSKGFNKI